MKKNVLYFILFLGVVSLSWCWSSDSEDNDSNLNTSWLSCSNYLTVNWWTWESLNLKAKIVADNVKNIVSNNWGNIEYLDCEKGKKVSEKTLIVKIKPDYSDPNIQNLTNQSSMINSQILNTKGIISSTRSNFESQAKQLQNQKENNLSQIAILSKNLDNLRKTQNLTSWDIGLQTQSIQDQISSLSESKAYTEKNIKILTANKQWDLNKINDNIKNLNKQLISTIKDCFEKVDNVFGLTEANKYKNDAYEDYISVRNSALKNKVESEFFNLKERFDRYDSMNSAEISSFVWDVSTLLKDAADAINASVPWGSLTQAQIDSYYSSYISLSNTSSTSILATKTSLDNIVNSLSTTENSYDNQITSLQNQLNTTVSNIQTLQINLDNLKNNKWESSMISIDSNINSIQSQITNLESSNRNIEQQLSALNESKSIQINQLENQLAQLNSNLNTIGINLNWQSIYAWTSWIVKEKSSSLGNKVWSNSLICQILPDKTSLKLQVYSSSDLPLPLEIKFSFDGKEYSTKLVNKLPYQDPVTQNYIYDASNSISLDDKTVSLSDVFSEWKTLDVHTVAENTAKVSNKIYIPINFVSNTIAWSKVKIKDETWNISEKSVVLWELDSSNIEIRSGLNKWEVICN